MSCREKRTPFSFAGEGGTAGVHFRPGERSPGILVHGWLQVCRIQLRSFNDIRNTGELAHTIIQDVEICVLFDRVTSCCRAADL